MISPCLIPSPTAEHGNLFDTMSLTALCICIQFSKLITYLLCIIYKLRKIKCKLQITAIAYSVYRFSKYCSSGCYPVSLCLSKRITTLMECIREEIRQKSALCIFYTFYITDKSKCLTVAYTSNHCIQTYIFELFHIRLHADPVITQKHHCFLAVFMNYIHHLFGKFCNFSSLEIYEGEIFLTRNSVSIVHITLIYNIFRSELNTGFLFKLV